MNLYTLTGRYPLGSLEGRDGEHLRFSPSTTVVGDGNIVLPAPVPVTLDAGGAFSVELIGTDDPAYAPTGWVWVVQELMDGGRAPWAFELTANADLSDLTAVATPAQVEYNALQATSIVAGAGLTGGGTLAADRTLAVVYGTSAGTAAQGNDSRIVGAAPIVGTGVTDRSGLQAQSVGRFVGVTAGGPPTAGAHLTGDWVVDQSGNTWVCIGGGTPGRWVSPGSDTFAPSALVWGNSARALDNRSIPGLSTSNGAAVADRQYALAFPIPAGKTLTVLNVHVTTGGNAGSVLRAGVYADNFGWPGELIADLGTVAADSTGWKTFTASTPIKGSRFVWVSVGSQNAATTAPQTSRLSYSPYFPSAVLATGGDDANYFACYAPIAGALPATWPKSRTSYFVSNLAPYISAKFGTDTTALTPYIPDRVPVLVATEAYEQGCVQEPNVYYDGAQWVMLYSAGWANEVLAYATAPTIDGPWTKHGALGFGTGRGSILQDSGTLYVFYDGKVRSGASITTLGSETTALAATAAVTTVANCSVIKDGSTYRMIFDGKGPAGGTTWKMGYATASAAAGPYTINTWPLTTIESTGLTVMNGGPHLTKVEAVFDLWYHGGAGNLPNDIYHATSSDCITWTPEGAPRIRRQHRFEVDQIADPFYVEDAGAGYLFWDALNNVAPESSAIMRSVPQSMTVAP